MERDASVTLVQSELQFAYSVPHGFREGLELAQLHPLFVRLRHWALPLPILVQLTRRTGARVAKHALGVTINMRPQCIPRDTCEGE